MSGQLLQQRVEAGAWNARIQHLNDHVNVFDALLDEPARGVHVTGEPLDCHGRAFSFLESMLGGARIIASCFLVTAASS